MRLSKYVFPVATVAAGLGVTLVLVGISAYCNTYQIQTPTQFTQSKPQGFLGNKLEYSRLKDGSEEIRVRENQQFILYQNLNGDNRIDRIRIEYFRTRDHIALESILVRDLNPEASKEFEQADALLSKVRDQYRQ